MTVTSLAEQKLNTNKDKIPHKKEYNFVITLTNWYGFLLEVDGCTNYSVLSEADRAQGNTEPPHARDDNSLVTGWYRFQGAAGDQMLDKCVLMYRCGSKFPGWLNGAHPTVAEGVVTRKVCYNFFSYCCWSINIIKVKNCSSYYVYELQRTPNPLSRYCGNAGAGKLH